MRLSTRLSEGALFGRSEGAGRKGSLPPPGSRRPWTEGELGTPAPLRARLQRGGLLQARAR